MSQQIAESYLSKLLLEHPRSGQRWIGIESERFVVSSDGRVLHYEPHVEGVLKSLVAKGWAVDYEVDGHILGLKKGFEAISLEPGAQFEISPSPQKSIFDLKALETKLDLEIKEALPKGARLNPASLNNQESIDQISLLPSPRYRLMDSHFARLKGRGQEMMRRTCGLQVNLDFSSESEGLSMLRTAFRLAPFLGTLFANSPLWGSHGEAIVVSDRHLIWAETDDERSGFISGLFDPQFSLSNYVNLLAKLSLMYAYDENGQVVDPQGRSLSELNESVIEKNILSASRQIFTDIRLKPCCIELRFLDQQPDLFRMAATAMVTGLLYSEENRRAIDTYLKDLSESKWRKLSERAARRGLAEEGIYPFCLEAFRLSGRGLLERGFGEERFLEPLESLLRSSLTVGEYLKREGQDPWNAGV